MNEVRGPFRFYTASYLVVLRPERARTLAELAEGVQACSDGTLFLHTFHSVGRHFYTRFSNDFAHWALTSCHDTHLAERLAAIDIRDVLSFEELRDALVTPLTRHVESIGDAAHRPASEPFYFCEQQSVEVPLGTEASTLRELAEGIRLLDLQTIHHHFVNSRIRLHLRTNDFSLWVEQALGLSGIARRLDRIDVAMKPLEALRREILSAIRSGGAA